ncbi:MAG: sensor histidine kinase [Terricaulis sp.]
MYQTSNVISLEGDAIAAAPSEFRMHEAHHRIANDLAVIASMVRLQATALKDRAEAITAEDARDVLAGAASRIDAVGRLHRTLCYSGGAPMLADFLKGICRDAASFAAVPGSDVRCRVDAVPEISAERTRALGLIVHELVLNALKYAHPSGVPVRIDIWCREEQGVIALDVADDGVGFPVGFDPECDGGFGFRMMRELARQLYARLTFEATPLGLICRLRARPIGG